MQEYHKEKYPSLCKFDRDFSQSNGGYLHDVNSSKY